MIGPGVLVLLLTAGPAGAGPFHHEGCGCGGCDCGADQVFLKADVAEHRYTVDVPVKNVPTATAKVVEEKVPCTRMVPVCITDPHTGCTRTEYCPQTVQETVKHTVIEVTPPEQECTTKKEERVEHCIKIFIERRPAGCAAPVCAPGH
jgi:hypothetical protein